MKAHALSLVFVITQCATAFDLDPGIEVSGSHSVDRVLSVDYDHDGLRDLFLLDENQNKLRVILQTSPREFGEEPVVVEAMAEGAHVEKGDLNGDGFDDLVIHENDTIRRLITSPDGFVALPDFLIGENRLDLKAVGDFDKDGEMDLAFFPARFDPNEEVNFQTPRIYWGDGENGFEEMPLFLGPENPEEPIRMEHLQTSRCEGARFRVAYQRYGQMGAVTITPQREFSFEEIRANTVIWIDVDGDGLCDEVSAGGGTDEITPHIFNLQLTVRTGVVGGGFVDSTVTQLRLPRGDLGIILLDFVEAGDLDGDGDQDLVLSDQYSTKFTPIINQGAQGWEAGEAVQMYQLTHGLQVEDLDQDGRAEVIVQHFPSSITGSLGRLVGFPGFARESVVFWADFARQFPQFSESETLGKTRRAVRPRWVDFDRDGYEDLVFGDFAKGEIISLQGQTEAMQFEEEFLGFTKGRDLLDFDLINVGDNSRPRVLAVSRNFGRLFFPDSPIWLQDSPFFRDLSDEIFSTLDASSSNPLFTNSFVRSANLDGDEYPDFITINPRTRELVWYELEFGWSLPKAIARIEGATATMENLSPYAVSIADSDGDGLDEIFFGRDGLQIFAYQIDQDEFSETTLLTGQAVRKLMVEDLDGDGDLDLISIADLLGGVGKILVNENVEGEFGEPMALGSAFKTADFAVGDIDQDGLADIVTGAGITSDALGNPVLFQEIGYLRQLAPMVFGEFIEIAEGRSPCSDLLLIDMDRDGRLDVVSSSRLGASIEVFANRETPPVIGLEEWLSIHGEANSDPDGDGRSNLVEYYFATDPAKSDGGDAFEFRQGAHWVTVYFSAKRRRDLDPREWSLVAEGSRDLVNWFEEPWELYHTVSRDLDDPELELVEVWFDINWGPKYFRWSLVYHPLEDEQK